MDDRHAFCSARQSRDSQPIFVQGSEPEPEPRKRRPAPWVSRRRRDNGNRRWGRRCGRLAGINGGFLKVELVQLAGIEQVSRQLGLIADLAQKEVVIRLAGMVRRGIKVLLAQNDTAGLIDPKAGLTPIDDQRRLTGERLLANDLDGLISPIFQKIWEQNLHQIACHFKRVDAPAHPGHGWIEGSRFSIVYLQGFSIMQPDPLWQKIGCTRGDIFHLIAADDPASPSFFQPGLDKETDGYSIQMIIVNRLSIYPNHTPDGVQDQIPDLFGEDCIPIKFTPVLATGENAEVSAITGSSAPVIVTKLAFTQPVPSGVP